jgi:cytidine deaminase
MVIKEVKFSFDQYNSIDDLEKQDADLLGKAREATQDAYAPYSHFRVGACALLKNGKIVTGSNQENASFPAGICAERTLLSTASSLYPGVGIVTLAISYHNRNGKSDHPVSPCGICRQSLFEFQERTGGRIRIIMSGMEGPVRIIENANDLLPLVFSARDID